MMFEHDEMFSFGNGERIDVPNIFGSGAYPIQPTVKEAKSAFVRAGFMNVDCVALKDLKKRSFLAQPGDIASVTINGKELTGINKKAPKDAHIVITYHSRANEEDPLENTNLSEEIGDQIDDLYFEAGQYFKNR